MPFGAEASVGALSRLCTTWGDNQGTRYVPNARGWYAYPVRTVRGALGASRPAPPVRTQRRPRGVLVSLDRRQALEHLVLSLIHI